MSISDAEKEQVRKLVRDELIGILEDAESALGVTKDPTGFGRKALQGMISLIQKRNGDSIDSEE